MANDPVDLSDLFAERSLWEVYRQAKPFYRNRFNCITMVLGAALLGAFSAAHFVGLRRAAHVVDFSALFSAWSNAGLSYTGTILGFLLAGFAVLFAVFRPATVVALRQITRKGETLDELKLIFVSFVDVFVHYMAFLFWCVVYLIAGGQNGPFDLIGGYLSTLSPLVPSAIMHLTFLAWGSWFLLLVLKLKSFIYNLYQVLLLGMADSLDS